MRFFIKKIRCFLVLLAVFVTANVSVADVLPYYSGSISNKTIGFAQLSQNTKVYLYPRVDADLLEDIHWNSYEVNLSRGAVEPREVFSVFVPELSLSYCMVVDIQDDWYKIIYDKNDIKTGWIKLDNKDYFWTLKDFYSHYGRKYGLYYMKNVDYRKRGLYSGAYSESQKLSGFTLIKSIKLNKISGNWALVTVVDIDSHPKIGYINWRESDGTIVLFPKIKAR